MSLRASATDLHVEATQRLSEALIASEARARRRVEMLAEVVFETDAQGVLVYLNDAWQTVAGVSVAATLGRGLAEFIVEGLSLAALRERAAAGGASAGRLPLRLRRADGSLRWIELSVAVVPPDGLVGVIYDVTRNKLAQEELAKLSLVASSTDNLVVMTDRDGHIEWVNDAFVSRTGYALAAVIGRKPGACLLLATDRIDQPELQGLPPGVSPAIRKFAHPRRWHGPALGDHGNELVIQIVDQSLQHLTPLRRHRPRQARLVLQRSRNQCFI